MILALNLLLLLNGNKMKSVSIVLFLCFSFVSVGQKYADIGEKEGEKFYIHTVETNNSLYSISKTYEISIEELRILNPTLSAGLKIGQTLWIPVKYDHHIHVVQKRETLYGISKRYSKPIDSIITHNPSIKEGLQKGQEIIIKNIIRPIQINSAEENPFNTSLTQDETEVYSEDSLIQYKVHAGETLYSISRRFMVPMDTLIQRNNLMVNALSEGQVLLIPLKKELEIKDRIEEDTLSQPLQIIPLNKTKDSSNYHVSVFLPFNLDTIDVRNIRPYAVEYYMGALLAIDSLRAINVSCEFHFIDYESKINPFDSVLISEEFGKSDLVFAPFNFNKAKKLKEWSVDKTLLVVFPLKSQNKLYDFRANDYFMEPEALAKDYILAKHLSNLDSVQLVFIKTRDSVENLKQQKFLDIYYSLDTPLKLVEANTTNYKYFTNKKNTKTIYILLSENEKLIEEVLVFAAEKENVKIYGSEHWIKKCKYVSNVENTTPFRYAVGTHLDYNSEPVKAFHRMYRREFNSDMTKMSGIGFDATLNIVMHSLYDVSLPQGLVHNFRFDFEGNPLNQNMGGYIIEFDNLDISIIE